MSTGRPTHDVVREALTLGRDAVMELFEHVQTKDDQMIADMRLQWIDAALAAMDQVPLTDTHRGEQT